MKQLTVSIMLLSAFFLSGCAIGKYEGQTAEEWFNDYADVEDRYQQFRDCVEEYENLDPSEKLQKTLIDRTATGYTPEQIREAYQKALNAGDATAANQIKQMYDDEIDYRTEEEFIGIFDYCE